MSKFILRRPPLATLLLAACLGNSPVTAQALYRGEALVISGKSYLPSPTTEEYGRGLLIVVAREGRHLEVESELRDLELSVKQRLFEGTMFFVVVPQGFETQWASAIRELASVETVNLNTRAYPSSAK